MKYRICGKTGEKLSVLGFGCMRFPVLPSDPSKVDVDRAVKMIRHGIDKGINYLDTAFGYHGGESEVIVGKAIKDGYREKVKIATKLPVWDVKTREDMDRIFNTQLERLGVDHVDFYLAHALNINEWNRVCDLGIKDFFQKLKDDGKITHLGFSFHDSYESFVKIVEDYDWEFCQIQYNYMDEDVQAGTKGLKYADEKGLGIIIMEPLRGGAIANPPEEVAAVIEPYSNGLSPAQMGLKWLLNHPECHVILSGMSDEKQLEENLVVSSIVDANIMSEEEVDSFRKAKDAFLARRKVSCTSCGYCMPCPKGVNIPNVFAHYNHYGIYGQNIFANVPKETREDKCVACGVCIDKCPQKIQIPDILKEIKDLSL